MTATETKTKTERFSTMRCRGTVAEEQRQRDRCGEPQRQGQSDRDPKKPGALSVSAVSEVYCPRAERNIQRQRQERESECKR